MNQESKLLVSIIYLAKVLSGLLVLCSVGGAAAWLRLSTVDERLRAGLLGLIVLVCLLLPLAGRAVYRRMDELQQRLHQQACAFALGVALCAGLAAGVLQLNLMLPKFNLLWVCAGMLGCWGLGLALADRHVN